MHGAYEWDVFLLVSLEVDEMHLVLVRDGLCAPCESPTPPLPLLARRCLQRSQAVWVPRID